ncbi:hypothetical protein [Paenibacillus sp. Soil750]|uniref:hypothetical protein n=1 Tax=Paenibacillus sp. Soil750 TaxID=1736398 RepID=UPI0012F9543D|nr:hypothetical protein [Paenibacillus sp. Soil750]
MALLNMPEKLLKVIWNGNFNMIFVNEDGTWQVDRKTKQDLITLNKSEIFEPSKLEALNQLMILNTKLLEATTVEYAKQAEKDYEFQYIIWEHQEKGSKDWAEDQGTEYLETPFEYKPFLTLRARIEEYYLEYHIDNLSSLMDQLKLEHHYDFDYDFGDSYTFSPVDDSLYFEIPFDEKVAIFIVGNKGFPQCYIDKDHLLYHKIKNDVLRVTKFALTYARNSVKKDLYEWFKAQFGYEMK